MMKFCQPHWDQLKQAIADKGLSDLVSPNGVEAMRRHTCHLKGEKETLENFDPLMSAQWAIVGNTFDLLQRTNINPLEALLNADHPEWHCPICYLNYLSEEHDKHCSNPKCEKLKGQRFETWIEMAADTVSKHAEGLKAKKSEDPGGGDAVSFSQ